MAENTSPTISELAAQVQELLDREAIRDCLYRYARGLDRHDHEILFSVYHEDAIDHHGEFLGPPDKFVPWAHALHEAQWKAHTHFITNPRIEIDGDIAHAECYVLFVLRRKDPALVDLGGGRYIDRLERRNGEWRIAARQHVVEWRTQGDDLLIENLDRQVKLVTYPAGTWDDTDPSYQRPFEIADTT
jgi:3-phenylpropionate/cinnamic acid dioxygenase small subunit